MRTVFLTPVLLLSAARALAALSSGGTPHRLNPPQGPEDNDARVETLSCRIVSFYPFPTPPPEGPLGWIFRDTHQAIVVKSSVAGGGTVLLDFMTGGGEFHPVWYDEGVKLAVFFGGNIRGEIRIRGNADGTGPKMVRLLDAARSYDTAMNLYGNNCRMFCARMEREVELINGSDDGGEKGSMKMAEIRCAVRVLGAGLLPAFYPLGIFLFVYASLQDLF